MEILNERFFSTKKSLARFKESIDRLKNCTQESDRSFFRDSVVQRFEFTYEVFWKFLRAYLDQKRALDVSQIGNPRTTFRAAHLEALLSIQELEDCLKMIEDRNQTSHTYDETFAEELANQTQLYAT